jgi:hypothetical protein
LNDPPFASNVPTFADDSYIYWLSDESTNSGGTNAFHLFRTQDYSLVEVISPPTWASEVFGNGNVTMGAVAYNGVLYHGVTANFDTTVGLGGWEIGYSKSTDNGATWSDWIIPDWHSIPGLEHYDGLWDWRKDDGNTISIAGDIQVDKNGLVHMLTGLTDFADSADERGYNAVVEFYETSEGVWDANILAEGDEVTDSSLYVAPDDAGGNATDPGLGQCGPSYMLATNMDRDFFVAQWVVAPNALADSVPVDIFYQTRHLDSAWSARINLTETAEMNENGAHLAPYLATVENGGTTTDYAFSMFWYEAGNTGTFINAINPSVVYIAAVPVRITSTTDVDDDIIAPGQFALEQNYPNPFNPSTSIKYSLAERSQVSLKIFDILGNEIATLVNADQEIGSYEVSFDASSLSSGLYFYTLKAGDFTSTKKMMLLK